MDPMTSSEWEISFEGNDKLECQNFVAAVNRYAYKNGKDKDDEWAARFAGACFSGDALSWWVGLDEEVQDSWKRLRKALLTEYAPTLQARSAVERPGAPAPAAAPTPAAAAPPPPPRLATPPPYIPRESRIAVLSGGLKLWVSRHSFDGAVGTTKDISEALRVRPFPQDNKIKALNFWRSGYDWVGISWTKDRPLSNPKGECYGALICATSSSSSSNSLTGGTQTDIWSISPTRKVSVNWIDESRNRGPLQPGMKSVEDSKVLYFLHPSTPHPVRPSLQYVTLELEDV